MRIGVFLSKKFEIILSLQLKTIPIFRTFFLEQGFVKKKCCSKKLLFTTKIFFDFKPAIQKIKDQISRFTFQKVRKNLLCNFPQKFLEHGTHSVCRSTLCCNFLNQNRSYAKLFEFHTTPIAFILMRMWKPCKTL